MALVPEQFSQYQQNMWAHPWFYYDNPFQPTWYQTPQAQQLAAQFTGSKEIARKLGALVNTPQGRRNVMAAGQVVRFNYSFFKPGHDPQPLLLVAGDHWRDGYLHGINLHYLSFVRTKQLLVSYCDMANFNYGNVMSDQYISDAYRTYKWSGVQRLQFENCKFLQAILGLDKIFSAGQLTAVVQEIKRMSEQQAVPTAGPTPAMPFQPPGPQATGS